MTTRSTVARHSNWNFRDLSIRGLLGTAPAERLTHWFLLSAGVLLAWIGIDQIGKCLTGGVRFEVADPVIGIPIRYVLLFIGMASAAVAALCLFTARTMFLLALVLWVSANFCLYRIGLWLMDWAQPYWLASFLPGSWDISPRTGGVIQAGLTAYLLCGSMAGLIAQRRGGANEQLIRASCPTCGGHVGFPVLNLGKKISCPHCQTAMTLRQPDENLKMSCFFCQGHVEFPGHAVGQKIQCPHCRKDITLKEPV